MQNETIAMKPARWILILLLLGLLSACDTLLATDDETTAGKVGCYTTSYAVAQGYGSIDEQIEAARFFKEAVGE